MNDDNNTTKMVRLDNVGLPVQPVADIAQVADAMLNARQRGFNVLAPTMRLQFMPPNHQISIRAVQFDATFNREQNQAKSNGSYYKVDGGNLALHGSSLAMLAAAAGISTTNTDTRLVEPGLWRSIVTITMKGFDGQRRAITKSKIVDLRDGSPEIAGWSNQRIANARQHGAALAESKASNRAIRAALGLKGSYTPAEAAQPFVFPVLVWVPNLDDPEINRMVTAAELGLIDQVYGGGVASGPVVADVGNMIDAEAAPALTDRQGLDAFEAPPPARERQRVAAHPDDDPQPTLVPEEQPPPVGDTCQHDQGDRVCGAEVTPRVADYSRRHFGKVLCRPHQPRA